MAKLKVGDRVRVPTGTFELVTLREPNDEGLDVERQPVYVEGEVIHITDEIAWEGEWHTDGRHVSVQPETGAPISVLEELVER